jgi:SNF2 family DNA or RNA helicase
MDPPPGHRSFKEPIIAKQSAAKLQATYVPAENGIAWWGVEDIPESLARIGMPCGRRATLRMAGVIGDRVSATEVEACITDLADAATAFKTLTRVAPLGVSARMWRQASRAVLRTGNSSSHDDVLATIAAAMPPAGHAVLSADESAVMAPHVLLRNFERSLSTARALRTGNLRARLRPYQAHGVCWLHDRVRLGRGAVLADDMGLGKTLQVIGLLATRQRTGPHLVVCPTSLLANWRREIRRFAPDLAVVQYHGAERRLPDRLAAATVVIASYALLRTDEAIRGRAWDIVVFDEAQQLKNPASQVTKAASAIQATSRIAVTGTPVENNLDELWSIFSVTSPGTLGAHSRFRQRIVRPIQERRSATAAAMLVSLVEPHMLRRTKDQVAGDLPPRVDSTVVCTLSPEQVRGYRQAVDRAFTAGFGSGFGRRGRILALLTELKQICNYPTPHREGEPPAPGRSGKFDRACEMLGQIAQDGERALVFTQYRGMGELLSSGLATALDRAAVPFLHGGLTLAQRDRLVRAFQEDEDAAPVLILSLRAAGFGLNLTRASNVLHYDRWWNPAVEEQATARAHRIGQRCTLTVYRLITEGTVEDHIERLHREKHGLAELISGDTAAALATLPDRQLRDVVDLDLTRA